MKSLLLRIWQWLGLPHSNFPPQQLRNRIDGELGITD